MLPGNIETFQYSIIKFAACRHSIFNILAQMQSFLPMKVLYKAGGPPARPSLLYPSLKLELVHVPFCSSSVLFDEFI